MDPIAFVYDLIFQDQAKGKGGDLFLSDQQMEVFSVLPYEDRIGIVSARGCGKTAMLALMGTWFTTVFPEAKTVITSPSKPQLMSCALPEYRLWLSRSLLWDFYESTTARIYLKEDRSKNSFIDARTASKDNPEAMSGLHGESLLIEIDEGSRVPDEIYRSLDNTLTGINNKIIVTGNGTRNSGAFHDIFHSDNHLWKTFSFDSKDSPFTSDAKYDQAKRKYGFDSNIFRADFRGLFVKAEADAFIGMDAVLKAMDREVTVTKDDVIEIGLDPAREGDDLTVLVWRQGNKVHLPIYREKTTGPDVENMVYDLVDHIREKTGYTGKINVKVDSTGLGGPICDYLELDREHDIVVFPVNFAGGGDDRYANMPTRIWGAIKDRIDHLSLPSEDEHKEDPEALISIDRFREELSIRKADYDTGKTRLQPKSKYKLDIGHSPDFADALGLCLFTAKNPRTILKNFDDQSSKTILKNLSYTGNLKRYASVYYSRDHFASVIWCLYGDGEFIITDEVLTDDNVARIASELNFRAGQQGYKKILGNDRCFTGNPTENIQGYFRNYKVRLQKNFRYDELGAIELLSNLTTTGNLKVSKNCNEAIKQLHNWSTDVKQAELERDYGLAYALLNVVSELKDDMIKKHRPITNNNPYKQEKNEEKVKYYNRGYLL
jgi:hypothetical protein